jgi:AcrR family transcriptional regulator
MKTTTDRGAATRNRILTAAGELFRRQGYAGTGVKAVLQASDVPYGSLYHFFPGGKEEVGVAVIESSGAVYRELVEQIYGAHADVAVATEEFFAGAAAVVEQTGYADACPIATLALEVASTNEPMREAAASVFDSWLEVLTVRLVEEGVAEQRARELSVELFCLIEGAFLLARTTRSVSPIHVAGAVAAESVRRALPRRRRRAQPGGART